MRRTLLGREKEREGEPYCHAALACSSEVSAPSMATVDADGESGALGVFGVYKKSGGLSARRADHN